MAHGWKLSLNCLKLEKNVLERGNRLSSPAKNGDKLTTVAIPIKLRGLAIGVISVKLKEDFSEETVSTIELVSERLASALESARLYEEARSRADREQSIAQITSAISASTVMRKFCRRPSVRSEIPCRILK